MVSGTTRRALIGAMAVAPLAVATPVVASAAMPTLEWDRVFANWQRAHYVAYEMPTDEDVSDELADAETAAWRIAMHTPAPHNKALHWKLDYLFGHSNGNEYCDPWHFDIVTLVVEDAKRLAGEA